MTGAGGQPEAPLRRTKSPLLTHLYRLGDANFRNRGSSRSRVCKRRDDQRSFARATSASANQQRKHLSDRPVDV